MTQSGSRWAYVKWRRPTNPNGEILGYTVTVARFNNSTCVSGVAVVCSNCSEMVCYTAWMFLSPTPGSHNKLTASSPASCSTHGQCGVHVVRSETNMATGRVNLVSLPREFDDHFYPFVILRSAKGRTVFWFAKLFFFNESYVNDFELSGGCKADEIDIRGKCYSTFIRSVRHPIHVTIRAISQVVRTIACILNLHFIMYLTRCNANEERRTLVSIAIFVIQQI